MSKWIFYHVAMFFYYKSLLIKSNPQILDFELLQAETEPK
jgi:hypothetical protein